MNPDAAAFLELYLNQNPELLAGAGDQIFKYNEIINGGSRYRQPVMPGEQRLVPVMQEQLQPRLPLSTQVRNV